MALCGSLLIAERFQPLLYDHAMMAAQGLALLLALASVARHLRAGTPACHRTLCSNLYRACHLYRSLPYNGRAGRGAPQGG